MGIAENIIEVSNRLPPFVKLVAISKTRSVDEILVAYHAGQRVFGENKAQEMAVKFPVLPKDIEWHFVGHLQTNKVKYIAPFVHLIQSVDSLKLLCEIDREALKNHRVIDCLMQFHIAEEETKFGLNYDEARKLLDSKVFPDLKYTRIVGVMGMATFTENAGQIRKEFRMLKNIFNNLKNQYFSGMDFFSVISMGMSDDYPIAIEEGSTLVRIGSKIFGERNYL